MLLISPPPLWVIETERSKALSCLIDSYHPPRLVLGSLEQGNCHPNFDDRSDCQPDILVTLDTSEYFMDTPGQFCFSYKDHRG